MKIIAAMILLFSSIFVYADGSQVETKESSFSKILVTGAVVEGMLVANAAMAAAEPQAYGWLVTAISPLALGASGSDAERVLTASGFVGLGQYNAHVLSDETYSKRERFKQNMIYWHGFGAVLWVVEKIAEREIKSDHVSVIPLKGGVELALNYSF